MFTTYYLWSGQRNVEDVKPDTLDEGLMQLERRVDGDWTLWCRGSRAPGSVKPALIAVKVAGQIIRFDRDLIAEVTS